MKRVALLLTLLALLLIPFAAAAQTPCTPTTGITCTTNLSLYLPAFNYPNWNVPVNNNMQLIDAASANWAQLNSSNVFTGNITAPLFVGNLTGNVSGTSGGLSGTPSIIINNLTANGSVTLPSVAGASTYCLQISSLGVLSNAGAACGATQVYPSAGIAVSTGTSWGASLAAPTSTIVGISDSQTLSNKSFGSGMTWPTFNQNTTGYAAGLAGGALGSVPYQSAANTTLFVASPTTASHTFLLGWQPSGSAIAPAAVDAATVIQANPHGYIGFAVGLITSIVANGQYSPSKITATATMQNIVATAAVFSCSVNPVITVEDCGTSAGVCGSPSALGSVTLTAANTITDGSISVATLTAGHYIAFETTAGTCSGLDVTGSIAY